MLLCSWHTEKVEQNRGQEDQAGSAFRRSDLERGGPDSVSEDRATAEQRAQAVDQGRGGKKASASGRQNGPN